MISHLAIVLTAAAVLAKSADWLVEFSARIARRFGVSDLVIGLTLTAIGTSVPELASSLAATVEGHAGIAIGNVVGSNIANIGLIVGVAALVRPFDTDPKMHERDGFVMFAASVAFFAVALDNRIDRHDAIGFLVVYVAYVAFAAVSDRGKIDHHFRHFIDFVFDFEFVKPLTSRIRRPQPSELDEAPEVADREPIAPRALAVEIAVVIACLVGVAAGARFFIAEAAWLALAIGIPDSVVGLSIVAVGTSLPELSVAVSAARKGNAGIVVGNVMGSNVANILFVLGLCATVGPLEVSEMSVVYTIPIQLFFSLGLLYLVKSGWRVTRRQGALAVCAYAGFLAVAIGAGWT